VNFQHGAYKDTLQSFPNMYVSSKTVTIWLR